MLVGRDFIFGIDGLDNFFRGVLRKGSLVALIGQPGAGKTTFASAICYSNALRGSKCLYLSFFEDREKLFSNVSGLGLDLYSVEAKGFLRFVKLPIMYSLDELSNLLFKLIDEFRPDVVVIDSVNSLLVPLIGEKRVVLQNVIYDLPKVINGLVVLVAESRDGVSYGAVNLDDIMYVADAVFVLKYWSEKGLLTRVLEVKKLRGSSLTITELPFTIVGGAGVKVFIPPILEGVSGEGGELDLGCKALRSVLDHIHLGWFLYISYRPHMLMSSVFVIPIIIHVVNGLRGLFISYTLSPEVLERTLIRVLTQYGVSRERSKEIIRKHFTFMSLNPYSYSVSELALKELTLIEQYAVDSVIFQGVDITGTIYRRGEYVRQLYNQLNHLKRRGLLVIRQGSYINKELQAINISLSDVFINYRPVRREGKLMLETLLWRRGIKAPHIITEDELNACCVECISSTINS